MNLRRNNILTLIGIILFSLNSFSQTVGPWNTNVLFQTPSYITTTDVEAVGMTSLYYETIDYLGNPVETFAYYSAPDGPVPAGGWPAVVLIHGGGFSASANYVQVWNDNGFAAIAMDTEGRLPVKVNGVRVVAPKPGPRRDGVWDDFELPIEDQWYYHAVALIIKGHSLIRSFPEVNPNKTGVSGFSWGGTLTSTVMGVDNRFSFAVPVYGAGFLSEADSHQGTAISAAEEVIVNTYFDGSVYFDNVTYPTMWVNGTNDHHFAITTQQKSSRAVNGATFLRYTLGMTHGGTPPRLVEEIYAFAHNVVNGTPTLPILGNPEIASNTASVTFSASSNVTSGKLYYTLDDGKWNERQWNETNASVSGNTISANVPSGATTIYFGATNSLGYVTSEYLLIDGSNTGGNTDSDPDPNDSEIFPEADSYTWDKFPDANYATKRLLIQQGAADSSRETFLKFNVSSLPESIDNIIMLQLTLDTEATAAIVCEAFLVTDDSWTETGITWNNIPASGVSLGTATHNGNVIEFDVTSSVLAESSGDGTFSIKIVSTELGGTNYKTYSKETASSDLEKPKLIITETSLSNDNVTLGDGAELSVYPNPMNDEFVIDLSSWQEASYTITNYTGQTLLSGVIKNGIASVDVSDLSSGFYLVRVSTDYDTVSKKIIKK